MNQHRDPNQPYDQNTELPLYDQGGLLPPGLTHSRPGPYQPGPSSPAAAPLKKKRHPVLIVIAAVIAGLFVIGLAGALIPDPEPSGDPLPNVVTTTSAPAPTATVTETAPAPVQETTTQAPPPKPVAKKWVQLSTVKGTDDDEGQTVTTQGGQVRVRYSFRDTTDGFMLGAVYVMNEGETLRENGGIPEIMVGSDDATGPKDTAAGVRTMRLDAGEYYLVVSAAGAKYTVTIEELR